MGGSGRRTTCIGAALWPNPGTPRLRVWGSEDARGRWAFRCHSLGPASLATVICALIFSSAGEGGVLLLYPPPQFLGLCTARGVGKSRAGRCAPHAFGMRGQPCSAWPTPYFCWVLGFFLLVLLSAAVALPLRWDRSSLKAAGLPVVNPGRSHPGSSAPLNASAMLGELSPLIATEYFGCC